MLDTEFQIEYVTLISLPSWSLTQSHSLEKPSMEKNVLKVGFLFNSDICLYAWDIFPIKIFMCLSRSRIFDISFGCLVSVYFWLEQKRTGFLVTI